MKEEIDKISQVIDALRSRASNPELEEDLLDWLRDPSYDCTEMVRLLNLREIIKILQEARGHLIDQLEDEVYDSEE